MLSLTRRRRRTTDEVGGRSVGSAHNFTCASTHVSSVCASVWYDQKNNILGARRGEASRLWSEAAAAAVATTSPRVHGQTVPYLGRRAPATRRRARSRLFRALSRLARSLQHATSVRRPPASYSYGKEDQGRGSELHPQANDGCRRPRPSPPAAPAPPGPRLQQWRRPPMLLQGADAAAAAPRRYVSHTPPHSTYGTPWTNFFSSSLTPCSFFPRRSSFCTCSRIYYTVAIFPHSAGARNS